MGAATSSFSKLRPPHRQKSNWTWYLPNWKVHLMITMHCCCHENYNPNKPHKVQVEGLQPRVWHNRHWDLPHAEQVQDLNADWKPSHTADYQPAHSANQQPALSADHCTMRRSPLQSVNRTIYQYGYLAPHFFLAPLFQMTNIWRKYLITFTFIVYLRSQWLDRNRSERFQIRVEHHLG